MKYLNQLYSWYGQKTVLSVIIITSLLIVYGFVVSKENTNNAESIVLDTTKAVKVSSVSLLSNPEQISFIGEVRAVSEAEIKPEKSGKIIKVNATLGQKVSAGQIIVELENANERASLLQAEGSYEVALANLAQNGVGVTEAETKLENALQTIRNTNQNSYNTVNNVVLGSVDLFFSQPETSIPGLRIGGVGNTSFLNNERVAFQTILPEWRDSINNTRDAEAELKNNRDVRVDTNRLLNLINTLIPLLNNDKSIGGYTPAEVEALRQSLTSAQSQITSTLGELDVVYTALKNAQESLYKAKLGASGGTASVSDGQVKQALGNLRSAQANYEKTILRSPINGTINAIDAKIGMFLNSMQSVATIANNGSSEVVAYVSDQERDLIAVDDEVQIEGNRKGKIVIIAPTIDNITKKIEVRIASSDQNLNIGETVRIFFQANTPTTIEQINIPLTAVKFENTNASIFLINDEKLTKVPVVTGEVRGRMINIISGLDQTTDFVIDVRGLNEGEKVTVQNK